MSISRRATTLFLSGSLLMGAATGCVQENGRAVGPEQNQENTGSRAQALTEEVERASEQPSGELNEASIVGLLEAFDDWDLCVGGGDLPGGLSFDPDDIDAQCVVGGDLEATVDLTCASDGEASGSMSYSVTLDADSIYAHYLFDDVCLNGVCGDGEGAVKLGHNAAGNPEIVIAGELTLYFQGEWRELKYGITLTAGDGFAQTEIVLWVDGLSYVVSLTAGEPGASVQVESGNGSWQCSVSSDGDNYSGSCSGEGSIEF